MSGSHEALPVTIGKKSTPGPPTKRPRVDVCAEDNDFAVSSSVASREMKMGADQVKVRIRPEVAKVEQQIVAWRRHFHRHPELSLKEEKTAKFIAGELGRMGIKVLEKQGGYGLVGVLRGAYPGRCIAIRADMDALPIKETVKEDYKSANPGVMHACGHDGHMAILLGAAAVLSKWRQRLRGTLKFVFQPAEEGYGGAKLMIDAGVLDAAPRVDEIYGLHLWNYQAVGTVGCRLGPIMAASDRFHVHVHGRGGHGAVPDGTADAVVAAGALISGLHTIVPRNVSPLDPAVLTVGTVNGGFASNVIADKVSLSGTVRTFCPKVQDTMIRRMGEVCHGLGTAFAVEAKLHYHKGYPCTINRSKPHLDNVVRAARKVVGEKGLVEPKQVMCAEDMSYFLDQRPGCFFFVGSALDTKDLRPHHKSNFDIDERCLAVGASIWVELIEDIMVNKGGSSGVDNGSG